MGSGDRTVLVTGARGGVGAACASALAGAGYRVIATDRDELDVLQPPATLPAHDILVFAHGIGAYGRLRNGDVEAFRRALAVNLVGTVEVLQRSAAASVAFVSSMAGRMTWPGRAFYAATKWGLEAVAETLHLEEPERQVIVLEPGALATGFASVAGGAGAPGVSRTPPWLTKREEAAIVGEALVGALARPDRFQRIPVGVDARRELALLDTMPRHEFVAQFRERLPRPADTDAPSGGR